MVVEGGRWEKRWYKDGEKKTLSDNLSLWFGDQNKAHLGNKDISDMLTTTNESWRPRLSLGQ